MNECMESTPPVLGTVSVPYKLALKRTGSEPGGSEGVLGSIPSLWIEEHTFREAGSPSQSHIRVASQDLRLFVTLHFIRSVCV